MPDSATITNWLSSLKRGGSDAANQLWKRYHERLLRLASRKLGELRKRSADEWDVVNAAFESFLKGVEAGRFPDLDDRDDLWQILLMLTDRRAKDLLRKELAQFRGGGAVRGDSIFHQVDQSSSQGFGQVEGREPSPETIEAILKSLQEHSDIFRDESLKIIALDKFQGYQNQEIAQRQKLSLRSVERKLQIIRRSLIEE